MIEKLKVQKNKLLKAKETINLRRKFTEKIINEIKKKMYLKVTLGGCIIKRVNQTVIISKEH